MNPTKLSKISTKKRREKVSFSATLPEDVHAVFADSNCVVKCSSNPLLDIRKSILEMIRFVKVQDWKDIEELIYCYIALNSPEVHVYVKDAFVSLSDPSYIKHYRTDRC